MKMLALIGLMVVVGPDAFAQGARDVPVERDLDRMDRLDRRLDRNLPPPVDPNVTPDNPDGVVGFDDVPDVYGDDILDSGPLAPGSPADIDDD